MVREVVVVGHGPSALSGLGAIVDSLTVVRCKGEPGPDLAAHMGSRTDYMVLRRERAYAGPGVRWELPHIPPEWADYWAACKPRANVLKVSHGLGAALLTVSKLAPERIYLYGCDRLLGNLETGKYFDTKPDAWKETLTCHDWPAEQRAIQGLGIPVIDLRDKCQISMSTIRT